MSSYLSKRYLTIPSVQETSKQTLASGGRSIRPTAGKGGPGAQSDYAWGRKRKRRPFPDNDLHL